VIRAKNGGYYQVRASWLTAHRFNVQTLIGVVRMQETTRRPRKLAVYQFWKGISAGPALKYFTWLAGGYPRIRMDPKTHEPQNSFHFFWCRFLIFFSCPKIICFQIEALRVRLTVLHPLSRAVTKLIWHHSAHAYSRLRQAWKRRIGNNGRCASSTLVSVCELHLFVIKCLESFESCTRIDAQAPLLFVNDVASQHISVL